MFEIGQIVFSKAGRDKTKTFIVISIQDDYLFLCDGKLRPIEKPKKKKMIHVQKTNTVIEDLKQKLLTDSAKNSDIKKAIISFETEKLDYNHLCVMK